MQGIIDYRGTGSCYPGTSTVRSLAPGDVNNEILMRFGYKYSSARLYCTARYILGNNTRRRRRGAAVRVSRHDVAPLRRGVSFKATFKHLARVRGAWFSGYVQASRSAAA
eukprot:COSAG02_NODE_2184_length_9580_cov_3.628837_3_plen_110_part_00